MQSRSELGLWAAAIALAALGTWLMFDAMPGINWGAWTLAAATGLFLFLRPSQKKPIFVTAAAATVIAFGAAITADPFIHALIVLSVILYLAMSMLLSTNPTFERITAAFTIPAPIVAFASAIVEAIKRAIEALHLVRSDAARSVVRGIAITAPVIIIFALLLSSADPVFAGWREAVIDLLESWAFLPRTIFFIGLLAITLGAYGYTAREDSSPAPVITVNRRQWLGSTERLILITSIAVLFYLFLAVQLSYFFGNLPEVTGSGMTFAEYARRGFAELTVVATASVILILVSERFGRDDARQASIRIATVALIVAVLLLLISAFNRVVLYEQAYGFTTARLYAQCYMIVVATALITLGNIIVRRTSGRSLFRITLAAATLVFIVLTYWNHESWIAGRNIDRLATTGRLDVAYLARDLSPNAVPLLVQRLASLPEPSKSELVRALRSHYSTHGRMFNRPWYEWNLRRNAARESLRSIGVLQD
ncbi:MAG TPA: DUF4173 domain-containing protein [Gemmatimonadaceae bacterium]|nr:DUF4173 domain-containing protein [Gemmatimonadaceae bacterium]